MRRFFILTALFITAITQSAQAETFPVIEDKVVLKECGDCHMAFAPQTLTRAVWRDIINNLSSHFGEDASSDPGTVKHILAYHEANASDVSDTRAAMKWTADTSYSRITEGPRFKDKHGGCSAAVWTHEKVKLKSNCLACHKTMQTDGSTDADIRFLPRGQQAECNELGAVGVLWNNLFQ